VYLIGLAIFLSLRRRNRLAGRKTRISKLKISPSTGMTVMSTGKTLSRSTIMKMMIKTQTMKVMTNNNNKINRRHRPMRMKQRRMRMSRKSLQTFDVNV
jgi:hypothetical protein